MTAAGRGVLSARTKVCSLEKLQQTPYETSSGTPGTDTVVVLGSRMVDVGQCACILWFLERVSFGLVPFNLAGLGILRYLPDTKERTTIVIISVEHFSGM